MKTKAEKIFKEELDMIEDLDLRDWVIKVFDQLCPDKFWTDPASHSSKHHPKPCNAKHGLVLHTRYAVYWGLKLLQAFNGDKDAVIAALLLHDIIKTEGIPGEHGVILANRIRITIGSSSHNQDLVIAGIESHMGCWTQPQKYCPTYYNDSTLQIRYIVHLADYCASRKACEWLKNKIKSS